MMSHLTVSVPWPEGAESTGFLAAKVACCGKCSTYLYLIDVRNCNMKLFMD